MFKPLTQLNYFFQLATERKLSGSDQLMYLHIFNKFNAAHWTETLRIKDAELKDLMRLYDTNGKPSSIEVIRRGRQRLKAKGFIDFTAGTGCEPEYRLPCLYPADTPADTPADSSANSYIRVREDVKDVKTKTLGGTRRRELSEIWVDEMHKPLGASERYELADLEEIHGYDKVKSAIEQTKKSRYYPTFADFKKTLKGGENVETADTYTNTTRTGNEPWAKY